MPLITSRGYNLQSNPMASAMQGYQQMGGLMDQRNDRQQRDIQQGLAGQQREFLAGGGLMGENAVLEAGQFGPEFQKSVIEMLNLADKRTGQVDAQGMDKMTRFAQYQSQKSKAGSGDPDFLVSQNQEIIDFARTLKNPAQIDSVLKMLDESPEDRVDMFGTISAINLPPKEFARRIENQQKAEAAASAGPKAVRPTAAAEDDRQFSQLQSMPDNTPAEKKAKQQYAQLIGAQAKRAGIDEKVQTQQAVGDIKVQQDIKKQQEIANIKTEQAIKTARGKSQVERIQGYIDSGVESADNLHSVSRSIELMNSVETGGVDQAILKAKQMMGIESGDEAELSYELGKSVLKQLKPTFGAAFTVNEMLELKRMEAGLSKSIPGNKRILNNLKKMLKRSAERGLRAAKDQGATFAYGEIENALSYRDKAAKKTSIDTSKATKTATGPNGEKMYLINNKWVKNG